MKTYIKLVEGFWEKKNSLNEKPSDLLNAKKTIDEIIHYLNEGKLAVCKKKAKQWIISEWIKKAILLNFKLSNMKIHDANCIKWYDKVDMRFSNFSEDAFREQKIRIVPGAFIRQGVYIGSNSVVMPSFINIGAYIGNNTMIDSGTTIGSCAYIGNNCHISTGVGIGGVLEPLQAKPVIIEDNCFIGAGSQIVEGILVEEGAVISTGVFLSASTKIVDRTDGRISYGRIPTYSVIVPGMLPAEKKELPGIYCVVIVKKVDKKTRDKTGINELLREC